MKQKGHKMSKSASKLKEKIYIRKTNNNWQYKITIKLNASKKYTVKLGFKNTEFRNNNFN